MRNYLQKVQCIGLISVVGLLLLPGQSRASVTIFVTTPTVAALPGDGNYIFSGTIISTDSSTDPLNSAFFNLDSGPSGADLSTAAEFSNFYAPFSLDPDQTYSGDLFSLSIDPAAPDGTYDADFDFVYGTSDSDPNFTFQVGPPAAVPEPSPISAFAFGFAAVGTLVLYRFRKNAARSA